MAQATGAKGRIVGDYLVGQRIGSGSFSVVWHARHRIHGTEVAIKEVATSRLNKKLQESLMSEVSILKRINHPNIICLHDIIEVPGKLHLVLEYCRGGDLSMYIKRHGQVPEAIAKNFIQQLGISRSTFAAGLQMVRENNLIHRDLKPQNLLLSTNDESAVLKIADFGFAGTGSLIKPTLSLHLYQSLQCNGMAETLCGSPLYMAPEIMQLQKYDAKADLWSVGAILFQLVTGETPFTGNNQRQLLQNIVKSTELHFPPVDKDLSSECKDLCQKLLRRNPVERLTFEEFFNHQFLSSRLPDNMLRRSSRSMDGIPSSESSPFWNTEESSREDCLPFFLDDESSGLEGSPSYFKRRSSMKSTSSFSLDTNADRREATSNVLNNMDFTSRYGGARNKLEKPSCIFDIFSDQNLNGTPKVMYQRLTRSRVADSLEYIDQDYVLVSGPPMDSFSTLATASRPSNVKYTLDGPPLASANRNTSPSVPMPIIGAMKNNTYCVGSLESRSSAPGTSQGSMDIGDALEQPSTYSVTRVESLQQFASAIRELVREKVESCRQLEALSIQLVILAIWKQALHIYHTQAALAMEGSPSQESTRLRRNSSKKHGFPDAEDCLGVFNSQMSENISSQIEREFLKEVEYAEELAKAIEPGNTKMPDAMEMIFQSALALGRNGGVDELMGNVENASLSYSKAVRLLLFLLVEGPSLILNPPFSLTISDRYRLQSYIDILNNRHGHSRSQG